MKTFCMLLWLLRCYGDDFLTWLWNNTPLSSKSYIRIQNDWFELFPARFMSIGFSYWNLFHDQKSSSNHRFPPPPA